MRHHPIVTKYEAKPLGEAEISFIRSSPVFKGAGAPDDPEIFAVYDIHESVTIVPGLLVKDVSFPTYFQQLERGIRFSVETTSSSGVKVFGDTVVLRRGEGRSGPADEGFAGTTAEEVIDVGAGEDYEFELIDHVTVDSPSWIMVLVKRSMTRAQIQICRKIVEEVAAGGEPSE